MAMLGLAGTAEAGFVEKATMELNLSRQPGVLVHF